MFDYKNLDLRESATLTLVENACEFNGNWSATLSIGLNSCVKLIFAMTEFFPMLTAVVNVD